MDINFENISTNIRSKAYPKIGSGSGRIVFDLGNGYVVKAARNRKGIEQNKAEHQISNIENWNIFAKVMAHSEDYSLIIMEKAQRISSFRDIWNYYHVKNNRQLLSSDEFQSNLIKYNLLTADLCRLSSWGIINGKPVIIDYGFTRTVMKYYRNRLF
jgi:hypothetical protein